jgi:membrane protein
MGGRARAVQEQLARRADTPIVRLALRWFHGYFEASRNSGSAATIYVFLSVGPLLLAATGLFHAAGGDANTIAEHLVAHNHLTADTARLVRQTFGTASHNALAASAAAIIGFLFWGIGIGQIYQDVYARAWRIHVRTLSDQARFTIWFFVLSGLVGLFFVFAETVRHSGWALGIPIWFVASTGFWLWTPRYLLHGEVGLRRLLPGALLASVVIGGATATSPLFLGPWLNTDGKYFGSFGVVLALLAWGFILTTISLVCAVFSPVWKEWCESEKHLPQTHGGPDRDTEPSLTSEVD